ncbi:substrate-binding domain-containing protein [Sedimentitalea sp.]|uniref:LacI family DNA-binding transcriptional regulator n=1 Tax=Sedimentitalea sp. TaxID=2048915 RepID=UPI003297FD64
MAKETGLSIATISRVINNNTNVNPKTRKRVLDACARLDYLPNSAARALSTSRSKTVAAIIPTIEHSVFAKFISGIEQTLDEQGYSLVMAISNADEEAELNAARKLLGMGAEAFILTGASHSAVLMQTLARHNVPHVLTSIWDPTNPAPTIGYDNAELAGEAVKYLIARGHRHIAVVHGPLSESDRTAARKQGAEAAGMGKAELQFIETELSVAGGKAAANRFLPANPECTAVLCFSDVLAMGVYFRLAEVGKSIPEDLSVMGFDNLDWSVETVPALTTINLPALAMGRSAATELVRNLEKGTSVRNQHLSAEIVERASVRRIK